MNILRAQTPTLRGPDFWIKLYRLREELRAAEIDEMERDWFEDDDDDDVKAQDKSKDEIIEMIENLTENLIHQLSQNQPMKIEFPRRKRENTSYSAGVGIGMKSNALSTTTSLCHHPEKLAQMLRVLSTIHHLLHTDSHATKRDIFYEDVAFYRTQQCVDEAVDNIACMFRVTRRSLHVLAASKGLVYGELSYVDWDGSVVDCSQNSSTGNAIPHHVNMIKEMKSEAKFVLLIEKEATFQRLLDSQFYSKCGPSILITGKGYPDVNTREMVKCLWEFLKIPILGLVDADPYGIEILSVYKFGSVSMSFDVHHLTTPCIKWLGVLPTDLVRLNVSPENLLDLTHRDTGRAQGLLTRPYMETVPGWKTQIESMLELKKKAEIQCLDSSYLANVYLPQKIAEGSWL
ncbi:meiotic recombination protein SPO11-like isoform X2 [Oscarella lobularis]|uniref:meiotic recombination protein SPO11-like isoform X2 n=1 Tax=Oscarella lobularis TaxID=121494 RepID=UPI003313E86F